VNTIFLIARIAFSAMFLIGAIGHLTKVDAMAQYVEYKSAPGGKAGVILSGLGLGIGGLSVLLGIYGDLGALLIVVMVIGINVFMHAFWKETDPTTRMTEMTAFNKNIALIGGALAFFLLFASAGAHVGWTITGPLFSL